jgi:pimeloyl-ACP methyl ester carboxylesterase
MCRHRSAAAWLAVWSRPDLPPEIARDSVQHSWRSYSGTLQNLILGAQPIEGLERLAFPLRCVAGERDRVVDARFLRELATRHPQLQLELWPGGHDLPLSAPERCVAAIQQLVQSGESARRS